MLWINRHRFVANIEWTYWKYVHCYRHIYKVYALQHFIFIFLKCYSSWTSEAFERDDDDDQAPTIFYPIIRTCYLFQTCIKRSQLEQNMWHYKIGDLLKEVQFIQIFYDRTRKGWPFNTCVCLREVTAYICLTVSIHNFIFHPLIKYYLVFQTQHFLQNCWHMLNNCIDLQKLIKANIASAWPKQQHFTGT